MLYPLECIRIKSFKQIGLNESIRAVVCLLFNCSHSIGRQLGRRFAAKSLVKQCEMKSETLAPNVERISS